jgi:Ca2+-binding RTX toxin-like protein
MSHTELNRYDIRNIAGNFSTSAQKGLRFQTESTPGNDRLKATRTQSTLYGLEGNDLMIGATGISSVLFGNDGNDKIQGGDRRDVLNLSVRQKSLNSVLGLGSGCQLRSF